jgi:hypothetical protein
LVDITQATWFTAVFGIIEEIAISCGDNQAGRGRPFPAEIKDVAWVDVSSVAAEICGIGTGCSINLPGAGVRSRRQLAGNTRIAVLPTAKEMQLTEELIIEAIEGVLLSVSCRECARSRIGAFKVNGAADILDGWNIAGEQPELVFQDRTAKGVAWFDRIIAVLFLMVVFGRRICPRREVRGSGRICAKTTSDLLTTQRVWCFRSV